MKAYITYCALATFILLTAACSSKKNHDEHEEVAGSDSEQWVEMDDFHTIMAASFHPYKDSANLAPAKLNASKMVAAAKTWNDASLPAKVDNAETRAKLKSLLEGTEAFEGLVKTADDEAISKSLTDLHHRFHELQEAWYGGHEGH